MHSLSSHKTLKSWGNHLAPFRPTYTMKIDCHYKQKGTGPPVVFLHGSYATSSTWKKMVEQLAARYHCILIDLPGHGGAPDSDDFSAPTIETELSYVEQIVARITDQPIHLVGHSYGGVVALALAMDGRVPVSELTMFEPVAVSVLDRIDDIQLIECLRTFLIKYRRDVSRNIPRVCGQVIDFWGGEGSFEQLPDFIQESMEQLVTNNIRHWDVCAAINSNPGDLQRCLVPARIVCGSGSHPIARAIAKQLHRQMVASKKYTIEGASHFLVTTHVDECVRVVQDSSFF